MNENQNRPPRHAYRLPPCPPYDIEGMESWLTELAKQGLMLSQDGFFCGIATFDRGSPCTMSYRLEAAPKNVSMFADDGGQPDPEAVEISKKYGWEYVASRGQFYIYRSSDPEARELNTDPQVQSLALRAVVRRERASVVSFFFWVFLYPLIFVRGQILRTMIEGKTWFVLFGIALLIWLFAGSVASLIHLRKIRKRLAGCDSINHRKAWRARAWRYRGAKAAFGTLLAVWLILLLHNWSVSVMEEDEFPLKDYPGKPPFATLADFAPEGTYEPMQLSFTNTYSKRADWLAPCVIHWKETATLSLPDDTCLSGGLYVDYYETIAPWLARALSRETFRAARFEKKYTVIDLPELDADFAAGYYDSVHFPTLIIQSGRYMMTVSFYQTSESYTMPLDEWVTLMAKSLPAD